MTNMIDRSLPASGRLAVLCGSALLAILPLVGCANSPFLQILLGGGPLLPGTSAITGDVTSVAPDTGMPLTLSGTVGGQYEGTYDENILEVYFDDKGAPLAALSRSVFTLDSPQQGSITSLNFVIVSDTLVSTDAGGLPIPIGLRTAATGEIIQGTGAYEGVTGQLNTDSTILFGTGAFGLGALESELVITLNP